MTGLGPMLVVVAATLNQAGGAVRYPTSRATSRPTTTSAAGDNIIIYKPGVCINWTRLQVELLGKVALREGALELFACATDLYGGDKTHESIVLLEGRPLHVYQALGLIGLQPGRPATWDPKTNTMLPATGQPLEVRVEWTFDGRRHQVDASEWMRRIDAPTRPLPPLPWVFAGSVRMPQGGILADEDGTVLTVVDFDGSIVTLDAHHPRDYEQLWVEARPDAIPPMNVPCTVIVRAAGLNLTMDRFGRVFIGERRIEPDDLVEWIRRELRRLPNARITVHVAPTAVEADVQTLRKQLRAAGAPDKAIRIEREPTSRFPTDDPDVGRAFLRDQLARQQSLLESAQREHKRLIGQLTSRQAVLEGQMSRIAEYIARLQDGLNYLAADSATSAPSQGAGAVGPPQVPVRPASTTRPR